VALVSPPLPQAAAERMEREAIKRARSFFIPGNEHAERRMAQFPGSQSRDPLWLLGRALPGQERLTEPPGEDRRRCERC
jgi:hypothetical protein